MTRLFRTLTGDERGTSVIELAMVAPVLATFLVGMTDISRAYSAKLLLVQAANRSIEKVQQYRTTSSTFSTLQTEAAAAASVAATDVTVDPWLECNGTRQATYDSVCTVGQTTRRYITVSINKKFTPMFGTRFFPGANQDGTYTLTGKAGMRTQ